MKPLLKIAILGFVCFGTVLGKWPAHPSWGHRFLCLLGDLWTWAGLREDKMINPAPGFWPILGPLGPTAGTAKSAKWSGKWPAHPSRVLIRFE